MPDEIKQDILLSVQADASGAGAAIDGLKDKLQGVNDTPIDKPFKTFKQEIREAINTAKEMQEQFGKNSKQFVQAAEHVATLKHEFTEFNATINAFNPANKLGALITLARGAIGTLEGVAGGMALLTGNSEKAEQVIKRLQALMALSNALTAINEVKNGWANLTAVMKSGILNVYETLTGFINGNTAAAEANAVAQEGVAVATTEASLAAKVFRTALLATGIGAVIVLIGELASHWDDIKESLGFASKEQEEYNKTLEDYKKGASGAIEKIDLVKEGFRLAEQGVISKSEALKKYNDTLGDSLGKTDSLATAEKNVLDKANAYIQITGLKAQATALFAKAGEEAAHALSAQNDDNTSFFAKAKAGIQSYLGFYYNATETLQKSQAEGTDEVVKKAKENGKTFEEEADKLLKKAGELQKVSGVKGNILENKEDKTGADKEKASLEALRKLIAESDELELTENEKKLLALDAAAQKAHTKTEQDIINYGNARAKIQDEIDNDADKRHKQRQEIIAKEDEEARKKASADAVKASQDAYQSQEEALLVQLANGEINQKQYAQKALEDSIAIDKKLLESKELTAADRQRITKELLNNEVRLEQEANTNRVQAINDGATAQKAALEQQFADGTLSQVAFNQAILDVDAQKNEALKQNAIKTGQDINQYNQATADANLKIATLERDRKKAINEQIGGDLAALSTLVGQTTVAGKALAVAGATISTYSAAQKAFESAFLPVPTVASPALGALYAAGAIITGLNNVKQILSVPIPGKGTGGAGSVPTPSIPNGTTAPTITSLATQQQNIQDVRVTNQAGQQAVKAYILNSDLQNNQQKQAFLNSVQTF